MKWIIFIILMVLVSGLVIAATEPTRPVKRAPYMPPPVIVKPNITAPVIPVNSVVVPPQVNITPVKGGEVIDLSNTGMIPPSMDTPKIIEPTLPTPTPYQPTSVNPIKHSFWYWLWPPHWFTKK